jgi:predicted site-specific integrase-resolvase
MAKYSSAREVIKFLGISPQKLYYWRKTNQIDFIKVANKIYLYDLTKFKGETTKKIHILYARVSNTKQVDDLKRQTQLLHTYAAANGIIPDKSIEDIGSGMNENRAGFIQLLDLVANNEVDTIYVTYKDRLVRFGFESFQQLFNKMNVKIVVINATAEEDFQSELTQDLISIIHYFSMKMYSNRRKQLKTITKELLSADIYK